MERVTRGPVTGLTRMETHSVGDVECGAEGYLRNRLRQADPELYIQLQDCWKRAGEWLPGLDKKKDSFNSYPHLANVERKLDEVVAGLEGEEGGRYTFFLSPIELFLLLTAVLFHDIGRLDEKGKEELDKAGENGEPKELSPPDCRMPIDVSLIHNNQDEEEFREALGADNWCDLESTGNGNTDDTKWPRECLRCLIRAREKDSQSVGSPLFPCGFEEDTFKECRLQAFEYSGMEELSEKDFCGKTAMCPLFCLACRQRGWHEKLVKFRPKVPGSKDHAVRSYEMLRNPAIFPSLGIREPQLARSLAAICLYHGAEANIGEYYNDDVLHTVYLDHYGKVREKEIAALLKLADNIDGSFRRTLPTYIRDGKPAEIIGRFREKVSGIAVAPPSQMVVTELGDWSLNHDMRERMRKIFEAEQPGTGEIEFTSESRVVPGLEDLVEGYGTTDPVETFWDVFCCLPHGEGNRTERHLSLKRRILDDLQLLPTPHRLKTCILPSVERPGDMRDVLFTKGSDEEAFVRQLCGDVVVLGAVMREVTKNRKTLHDVYVSGPLAGIGLQLHAWLIEYKEHLYTADGRETFEPVFDKAYLKRVCGCMEELNEGVLGLSEFSYETLAAGLRDPDVKRVKMAVRRLSIVTQQMNPRRNDNMDTIDEKMDAIWYGETLWRWRVEEYSGAEEDVAAKLRRAAALTCRSATMLEELRERIGTDNSGGADEGREQARKLKEEFDKERKELEDAEKQLEEKKRQAGTTKREIEREIEKIKVQIYDLIVKKEATEKDLGKRPDWNRCCSLHKQIKANHETVEGICKDITRDLQEQGTGGNQPKSAPKGISLDGLSASAIGRTGQDMAKMVFEMETSYLRERNPAKRFSDQIAEYLSGESKTCSRGLTALSKIILGWAEFLVERGEEMTEDFASSFAFKQETFFEAIEKSIGRSNKWFCFCRGIDAWRDAEKDAEKWVECAHDLEKKNTQAESCLREYLKEIVRIAEGCLAVEKSQQRLMKRVAKDATITEVNSETWYTWEVGQLRKAALFLLQMAECCHRDGDARSGEKQYKLVVGKDVKKRIEELASPVDY